MWKYIGKIEDLKSKYCFDSYAFGLIGKLVSIEPIRTTIHIDTYNDNEITQWEGNVYPYAKEVKLETKYIQDMINDGVVEEIN